MAQPIELYAYDLSNGMAAMYGPMLTGMPIEGIWCVASSLFSSLPSNANPQLCRHTSLVLFGMEVWYGQGIHAVSPPGTTHVRFLFSSSCPSLADRASFPQHGTPKKRIPVGTTQLDKQTFLEYLEGLRESYTSERYHLLTWNCKRLSLA
jgi:hypothetical protein